MTDLRTRNNASSKKSYEKSIERQYADDYEHEMVRQHILITPDTDAYHWSIVPEEYLYESGYISDFNKHRLERLMRKKDKKEGANRVRDYGFDGLARTRIGSSVVFNGLQAKYYIHKQVCAGDIGSFFAMQISLTLKNPLSKGYLYTTSGLQADLAGNVANPSYPIRHILHPWKHPDARTAQIVPPTQQDCDKLLRADQVDALKQLEDKDGINALNTPCRWGKTIVAGHHTKQINAKLVVAIAPLLVSVENLQDRLACFIPGYSSLLVDSDTGGTTNIDEIKKFLASEGNHIIYSTFKSAVDILSELLTDCEDKYILGDEIHNANPQLCEFVQQFPKGLVMSATMPEEIVNQLDINHTVYIPFAQAIRDGIVVDYTLWLPHLTKASDGTTSLDIEIPVEFSTYDSDLTAKAFYLATVMLKTGSRRCISYLGRQEECDRFGEVVAHIFEMYHGLTIWTGKIDSSICKIKRKEVMEEFQTGQDDVYHILTSVRILDEAVDIPRCDSVFITNIGEHSSDIRMMQRSQRSSTKDPKNPSKHNNIILWADGWEKCVGALDLLREADPEFHKKIRIADCNYDRSGEVARIESVKEEAIVFEKWVNMKCLNYADKQLMLVQKYIEFVGANKREPRNKEGESDLYFGRKHWLASVKGLGAHVLYQSSKDLLDKTFPRWSDTLEDKQHAKIRLLHKFVTENDRLPATYRKRDEDTRTEAQKYENDLGEILSTFKFARQRKLGLITKGAQNKIFDSSEKMLNELIPGWHKTQKEIAIENCEKIIQYHKDNSTFPQYDTPLIGNVYSHFRTKIISKKVISYPYDVIATKLDTYNKDWRQTNDTKQDVLIDTIVKFIKDNKRLPMNYSTPINETEEYEQSLGNKLTGFRRFLQGKDSHQTISDSNKIKLDIAMPNWLTIGAKTLIKQTKDLQTMKNIKKFIEENKRMPISRGKPTEEQKAEHDLAIFISKSRGLYKDGKLPSELVSSFNSIPSFSW